MKKFVLFVGMLAMMCGISLFADQARANTITLNMNVTIDGTGVHSSASWGTITMTDDGNAVDVSIDFANNSYKFLGLYLNYNDSRFPIAGGYNTWKLVSGSNAYTGAASENNQKAGGYPIKFDLQIPKNGNINLFGDFSGVLTLAKTNGDQADLNVADFLFPDANGVYSGIHIGAIDNAGNSVWAGATSTPVPEPSILILLGTGLIGILGIGRKK